MKNTASERVKEDIKKVMEDLKDELRAHHFYQGFDVEERTAFVKSYVPEQVQYRSEELLKSLLIYLEDEAIEKLKDTEARVQNRFFDKTLKDRLKEWVDTQARLILSELSTTPFSAAQREALIKAGTIFVLGASTTTLTSLAVPYIALITAIIGGLITLWLTYQTYNKTYEKATHKLGEDLVNNTYRYLDESKRYLDDWLREVIKTYQAYFNDFCKEEGLEELCY